jgi:hypothetical protein
MHIKSYDWVADVPASKCYLFYVLYWIYAAKVCNKKMKK